MLLRQYDDLQPKMLVLHRGSMAVDTANIA